MATYSKIPLSQSANGKAIMVALSSAPGSLIHSTGISSANIDEVWLYASNVSAGDTLLTLYWGSSASADIASVITIQAYAGLTLISPGLILRGDDSSGSTIYTTVQQPSAVEIVGYVNRITA
jgi:hypothetical protein